MAESTPRKPSLSRKSLIAQALFVIMMLVIARVLWMRQQPEHLHMTPSGDNPLGFIALTESTCYRAVRLDFGLQVGETGICAETLRSGEVRLIGKESDQYNIYARVPDDALVSHGNLYYIVTHQSSQSRREPDNMVVWARRTGGNIGAKDTFSSNRAPGGHDMGLFLMPPPTSAAVTGQKRTSLATMEIPTAGFQVRQLPLSGGTPQDAPIPPGTSFVLCADHVFWVQPAVEQIAEMEQGETRQDRKHWKETTARGDLMLTSLPDGTTRCIRHNIHSSTALVAGTSGVSWWEPALYPRPADFFYARASDGRVSTLGTLPALNGAPACAELGERIYWTDWNAATESVTLMSAASDGTDRHEVTGIIGKRQIGHLQLYVYQGSLYGYMQETSVGGKEDYPLSLCRIHPERPDPIEIVRKISGRGVAADSVNYFQFVGGYLYLRLPGFAMSRIPLRP